MIKYSCGIGYERVNNKCVDQRNILVFYRYKLSKQNRWTIFLNENTYVGPYALEVSGSSHDASDGRNVFFALFKANEDDEKYSNFGYENFREHLKANFVAMQNFTNTIYSCLISGKQVAASKEVLYLPFDMFIKDYDCKSFTMSSCLDNLSCDKTKNITDTKVSTTESRSACLKAEFDLLYCSLFFMIMISIILNL